MLSFTGLDGTSEDIEFSAPRLHALIDYTTISTGNPVADENAKQVIERSFLYLTGHPNAADELAFGETTWKIRISPNAIKAATSSALLIGLLHASGATGLAALVLPVVIPMLFDIETIRITVKDDMILTEMRLNKSLRDTPLDPHRIYLKLSPEIRKSISFSEFVETLDKLCVTGHAEESETRGLFRLAKERKLKISVE